MEGGWGRVRGCDVAAGLVVVLTRGKGERDGSQVCLSALKDGCATAGLDAPVKNDA